MMKRLHTYISIGALLLLLVGCKPTQLTQITQEVSNPRPSWVMNRPLSSAHYIGVGSASKVAAPLDFSQVAKQNALNDLASEISITIEGESFLNTMEYNTQFSEEFNSTIKTTISEQLEGYEIMGSWEDSDEYWVYYRLNQAAHAQIKKEKKDNAIAASKDFFAKALQAKEDLKIKQSVQMHALSLMKLKGYWNETIRTDLNGESVFLDHEIYASLTEVLNGLTLSSPVTAVELNAMNSFELEIPFMVKLNGVPAQDVPVFYDFKRVQYKRPQGVFTSVDGVASAVVSQISRFETNNRLEIQIDKEELLSGVSDKALHKVLEQQLIAERLSMPISMNLPKVMVQSVERKLDKPHNAFILAQAAKTELSKMGFILTDDPNKADYLLRIDANSTQGDLAMGFYSAYVNMTLKMQQLDNEHIVFEASETGIKGLQLNFLSASDEAYKKAAQNLKRKMIPNLLEIML